MRTPEGGYAKTREVCAGVNKERWQLQQMGLHGAERKLEGGLRTPTVSQRLTVL